MSEPETEEAEAGAGRQTYEFIGDDKMLRCFIYEVATTHCGEIYSADVLDEVYEWICMGKIAKPKLTIAK